MELRIGTAGWQVTAAERARLGLDGAGTHLQRYAAHLDAAEINSSFYRPHAASTYAGWAAQTPPSFRFAVKLPRSITHQARLQGAEPLLDEFLAQVAGLGARLGCLLVQLPPSLAFDESGADTFLRALRQRHADAVALEPRHASWCAPAAEALLRQHRVARVLADPQVDARGTVPGGWPALVYLRLHGSPDIHRSAYARPWLARLAARVARARGETAALWCIFDNTAAGHAFGDALALRAALAGGGPRTLAASLSRAPRAPC